MEESRRQFKGHEMQRLCLEGKSGHVGLGERWRQRKGKKEGGVQGYACRVA